MLSDYFYVVGLGIICVLFLNFFLENFWRKEIIINLNNENILNFIKDFYKILNMFSFML